MQVILLEKMQNLGDLGDEVSVKSGFGRNFLIPAGKALPANKKNRETFETRRAELEALAAKAQSEAEKRKAKLVATGEINIVANAGIEGKLFGSVSALDIVAALNEVGVNIERNEVRLPAGPLRHTGEYTIDIQLHSDVIVPIKVNVLSDGHDKTESETKKAELSAPTEASQAEEQDA